MGNLNDVTQAMQQLKLGATLKEIAACLPRSEAAIEKVLEDLRDLLREPASAEVVRHSKETTTHFVWQIAANSQTGARVCVHQFKPVSEAAVGHANTVHNHRYSFVSLVLTGGYTEEVYGISEAITSLDRLASVPIPEVIKVTAGQAAIVHHETFHRVTRLLPDTLTLVVKAPPQARHSVSLNVGTGVVSVHYSWPDRLLRLVDAVERAIGASRSERN